MPTSSSPPTVTLAPKSEKDELPTKVQVAPSTEALGASDRYAEERVLGEGGMGRVVLVRDQLVGRHVALKHLNKLARDDEASRARFAREARLQGQLEHPAIVPVYDVGSNADGSPFFTMKRVRGQSLADVLDQMRHGEASRFSQRKLLSAFSQLCAAVHYAHERGVVHRDIKPTNIMLGPYGEVYLLDWGVAKVVGEPSFRDPSSESIDASAGIVTGTGAVMGTINTMAPEQAIGGEVDPRTDVYALGAVLFEILTLEPFHPKGAFDEVLAKVVRGVEARASVRAPNAEVPPELEQLVVSATKLHPADRLASAMTMNERIEAYLDGDRDIRLRRESALKHAEAAKKAADDALRPLEAGAAPDGAREEALRSSALREVGKALALDPGNRDALGTLVELLTRPPKAVPREVAQEQAIGLRRRLRIGGIASAVVYGYISLNAFSTWSLGVHDYGIFFTAHAMWACAFAASLITAFFPSYATLFVTFLIGISTSAYITSVYGPFLMVPTLIASHTILFALVQSWRVRIAVVVTASIAWTVSVFGEMGGLFPNIVRFVDGDMVIHSPVLGLPEKTTSIYLFASVLAMIVAPALVVGAVRSAWERTDAAMRLQAWQLRRLVSDKATESIRPPAE